MQIYAKIPTLCCPFTAQRPGSLSESACPKKKIVPNMSDIFHDDEMEDSISHGSSEVDLTTVSIEGVKTPDDLTTPEAMNSSVFEGELEWESEFFRP